MPIDSTPQAATIEVEDLGRGEGNNDWGEWRAGVSLVEGRVRVLPRGSVDEESK